jgi:hypothetical protein
MRKGNTKGTGIVEALVPGAHLSMTIGIVTTMT